jgi:acetoacetate decarboxylase
MGFVKTADELARLERPLTTPRFVNGQSLRVDFLTDPDWLESVLPPPLTPADTPRMTAMVGRWQSNCVGDYNGGAIYVAARHGDIEGDYVLSMWMNTDKAIIFGRDVFGEPKKQGHGQIYRSGERMTAWCERDGVKLIQLDVTLEAHHGATTLTGNNFNYKSRPAADGVGLQEDAILTLAVGRRELTTNSEGSGALKLTGTVHDPLDEIKVLEVLRGAYGEGNLLSRCSAVATVPAADFLPYHYGRHDDWSVLDSEYPAWRTT